MVDIYSRSDLPDDQTILPVHLYGIPCDLDRIKAICQRHCLHLIEDASHAFGSKYKGRYIGADSEFACFSLYPTKNLGAFGDSGIVVSSKTNDADKVRDLLYFSRDPLNGTFNENAIHAQMDSLQAALISVVLDHFTQMALRRQYLAKLYADTLDGYVQFLPQLVSENVVPYMFCIYADNRDNLSAYLKKRGVMTQVHYRYDLHHFKQFASRSWSLPYTEWHNAHVLSLHTSPDLSDEEVYYICETVLSYFK